MRKVFFDDEENGYFKKEKRPNANPLAMGGQRTYLFYISAVTLYFPTDPNMAFEMLKGTLTNVLPMILIGGWINWTFAGFITSK